MPAPCEIADAVKALRSRTGEEFLLSENSVEGTELHVVYAKEHQLPERYSQTKGMFGFRVPLRFPNACPEDCFFLVPDTIKLVDEDPVRRSKDINRAGVTQNFLKGSGLDNVPVLVFSWHLWNKVSWDRNKHNLVDHYLHCLRRFEQEEHD